MPLSFREQIEARALAVLIGATAAGSAVDTDRDVPVDATKLPAITLYTWNDSSELLSKAGTAPEYLTTLDLIVIARVAAADIGTVRTALKQLVDQIKETLLRAPSLYRNATGAIDVIRIGRLSTKMTIQGESNTNIGEAVLTFPVEYQDEFAPIITQPLRRIAVTFAPNAGRVPGPQSTATLPVPQGVALGAIRWDAWYTPGNALTNAVAADLSPPQFQYRAPFFATVSGGAVSYPAATQASMDAEIDAAVSAGIAFWAFLAHAPGDPLTAAFTLYQSSTHAKPGYAFIEDLADLWWGGAPLASFTDLVSRTTDPLYLTAPRGWPILFFLDSGADDIATRYGGDAGLQAAMQYLRSQVQAACGTEPYMVIMAPTPARLAELLPLGFDAVAVYAWPGSVGVPTPYPQLADAAEASWPALAQVGPVVPTAMTGWNPSPRVLTPNALFGSETSLPATAYYTDGTPVQIAAHIARALCWVEGNPAQAPAQVALVYNWNEFDEGGGSLCPTYLAGNPAGDASRLQALALITQST